MVEPNFIFMDIKSQHFFRVYGYLLVGFRIRIFTGDRSNNIHSPGPVIWEVSPYLSPFDPIYTLLGLSFHQRGKPSHTNLCTFSRGYNRIWKGIPISDCLREEWPLVNFSSCSGGLKGNEWSFLLCLIWGMVSVGMLAAPFKTLYKRISLLSLLLFLRDSHFSFSSILVILPLSKL